MPYKIHSSRKGLLGKWMIYLDAMMAKIRRFLAFSLRTNEGYSCQRQPYKLITTHASHQYGGSTVVIATTQHDANNGTSFFASLTARELHVARYFVPSPASFVRNHFFVQSLVRTFFCIISAVSSSHVRALQGVRRSLT